MSLAFIAPEEIILTSDSPCCSGYAKPIKRGLMTNKALANAERVADEAIDTLSRLGKMFKEHLDQVDATYPGSFTYEREFLLMTEATVIHLRRELEGEG